jgi:hypothetical protein
MNVDVPYGKQQDGSDASISHFEMDMKVPFAGQDLTQAGNDPTKHAYTFKNTITDKDVTPDGKKLTESIYGKNKVTTYLRFVVTSTKDGNNAWTSKVKNPDFRTGQSGKTYFLVSEDGKNLYAYEYNVKDKKPMGTAGQLIMKIDGTKLVLQETDYAKDLLNIASHTDLAHTLLINIGLRAEFTACPIEILPEIIVPVKVIRPLDAKGDNSHVFTDAVTQGNVLKVAELLKKGFIDWRNKWEFLDANRDYYKYYDVKAPVKVDLDNMTTNMNGNDINKDLMKDVAPETFAYFKTTTTGGSAVVGSYKSGSKTVNVEKDFGTIRFDNVNNVAHEFKVKIPLIVSYYWGDIVTDVTITVNPTTGGNTN